LPVLLRKTYGFRNEDIGLSEALSRVYYIILNINIISGFAPLPRLHLFLPAGEHRMDIALVEHRLQFYSRAGEMPNMWLDDWYKYHKP
jgi:hypothetical protein